ncbi:hypothetical protein EVAR_17237_1 [Eumeta japonica]|uniref:Uncharacterized protein n=1 Tax=Eumeta variegata TaxID=151549 RepID=A0A4C1TT78_EUMVA|nr:hypothetical protein EVAR_17237_1 [Eumeta japonica]
MARYIYARSKRPRLRLLRAAPYCISMHREQRIRWVARAGSSRWHLPRLKTFAETFNGGRLLKETRKEDAAVLHRARLRPAAVERWSLLGLCNAVLEKSAMFPRGRCAGVHFAFFAEITADREALRAQLVREVPYKK